MPYHVLLDQAGEARLGKLRIGTTRRGIGPCYADKASRLGIRVQDLLDEAILRKKIMAALEPKRHALRPHAKDPALDLHAMTEEYVTYGHRLEPHITDTALLCHETLEQGGTVVFEGAQGTMLDIDHGTYPFVTSSNPVAGAACVGRRRRAEGDRRGVGRGEGLRRRASARARSRPSSTTTSAATCSSAGTSTAPPPAASAAAAGSTWSRCATRRGSTASPASSITKLDVLAGIDPLQVCTRYRHGEGAVFDDFPYHQSILHSAEARERGAARVRGRHQRVPHDRRPARARRATTSTSSPSSSACRSSWSASARAATR